MINYIIKHFLIFGDWGLGLIPNPKSPISMFYSSKNKKLFINKLLYNI